MRPPVRVGRQSSQQRIRLFQRPTAEHSDFQILLARPHLQVLLVLAVRLPQHQFPPAEQRLRPPHHPERQALHPEDQQARRQAHHPERPALRREEQLARPHPERLQVYQALRQEEQ